MNKILWLSAATLLLLLFLTGYRLREFLVKPDVLKLTPKIVVVKKVKPEVLHTWVVAEGIAEAVHKAYLMFDRPDVVDYIGKMEDGSSIREGSRVFGPNDHLNKGQLLAQIDSRECSSHIEVLEAQLGSAMALKMEAEARQTSKKNLLYQAKMDFQRIQQIHKKGSLSQDKLEHAELSMKNAELDLQTADNRLSAASYEIQKIEASLNQLTVKLDKNSLFAPFDGVITAVNIREGNYYYPPSRINNDEQELASAIVLMDDSLYEIQLEIPDDQASNIKEGQAAYVVQNTWSKQGLSVQQWPFREDDYSTGTVWSVSPSISMQKHSRRVVVRLQQSTGLRNGMPVHVMIETEIKPNAIKLPIEYLSFREGAPFVYVLNKSSRVDLRWLKIKVHGLDEIEVLGGLTAGEQVVIRGQHRLKSGSKVIIAETPDEQSASESVPEYTTK
ncbi:efflux RND transporter periplasmic adaptor subunit [Endozoicomonas atrinae]|uniref:efflux RND transporter periplasmic adaptor subunit n=1 Tax=Endozoicomonas atrinae TaxID=1333660 RepID=UPI0008246468|nr:efflux RND transporter periplasmic adaptor subunit [Endozoicomonas atrinae]